MEEENILRAEQMGRDIALNGTEEERIAFVESMQETIQYNSEQIAYGSKNPETRQALDEARAAYAAYLVALNKE